MVQRLTSPQRILEIGGNGNDWAGGNTLLTYDTASAGKIQPKLPIQGEGLGGADPRTQPAVNTAFRINEDFPTAVGNLNAAVGQPFQGGGQLIHIPGEFDHQFAHLVGGDLGTDDVGGDVKVFCQTVGDGHLYHLAGKREGDPLFHGRFTMGNYFQDNLGVVVGFLVMALLGFSWKF